MTALSAADYESNNTMFHYNGENMDNKMSEHSLYLNCSLEQEVLRYFKMSDKPQLISSLVQLCNFYMKNFSCEDVVKIKLLELLFTVTREAVELGVPFDEIILIKNDILNNLDNKKTIEEFCEWIGQEMVESYFDKFSQYLSCHKKKLVKTVIRYLDENYNQNITLDILAARVYLSRSYLAHIFKQETGSTIMEYLILKRVKEAKRLLATTDLPIAVVANKVGYQDFSYFGRIFKKRTGCTPKGYRYPNIKDISNKPLIIA